MADNPLALAFGKVMVPVDMRHLENSRQPIQMAGAIAAANDGELFLMTAANPLGKHITDTPEQQRKAFEDWAGRLAGEAGCQVTPVFRSHESPERAILQECRERDVDLIVMASHNPRLTDHLFGSHASHIVRDAPCSVMVLR